MSQGIDKFKMYVCSGGRFEYVSNMPMYLPVDCYRVPLKLPVTPEKPLTYKVLLKCIFKKLGLPLDAPIHIKYKVDHYVIDITDDEDDFGEFLCHAISNSLNNSPIEIYVVDIVRNVSGMGSNHPSSSSSGFQQHFQQIQTQEYTQPPENQQYQTFSVPFQPQPPPPYFQSFPQYHYHAAPEFPINNTYPIQINQDTHFKVVELARDDQESFHHVQENSQCHVEVPDDHPHDYDHYGEAKVSKVKNIDHAFVNDVVDDDDDDDEVPDPKDTYEKEIPMKASKNDIFWNMPPLLCENDREEIKRPVSMYEPSYRVKLGQTFESKEELLLQLHTKCVEEGFQITPKKSDKSRYLAYCLLPNCRWKISAARIKDSNNFQVRKFIDVHTCSRTQIMNNNKHASKKVLGHILKELMTLEGRVYRGKEIKLDMSSRFKISLSYTQAWRAKCYAIELLRGSVEESFRVLPLYLHNLKLKNEGSTTNVITDEKDRFLMCYMSIGAAVSNYILF